LSRTAMYANHDFFLKQYICDFMAYQILIILIMPNRLIY
ncbi:MAG: hypothetical protein ACI952_002580, partial [Flavobacteriales bacterium]